MDQAFIYTGNSIPVHLLPGRYFIELWGSQSDTDGLDAYAFGAYVSGYLKIEQSVTFYLFIGEKGRKGNYTFNGGGQGQFTGGGATDLRVVNGSWDNIHSLISRIIVAAGAGGPDTYEKGGDGGGLIGFNSEGGYGKGGTQTKGGDGIIKGGFGIGGGLNTYTSNGNGGGGGGYYGGGSSSVINNYGGGGGSSFISGYPGCNAIIESSNPIIHSNQSIHYSGYYFLNPIMIDGASQMPSPDGGFETGHHGHGAARIILSRDKSIISNIIIPFPPIHFLVHLNLFFHLVNS